jgi:hypothetical protein
MPLKSGANPPSIEFKNGVKVVIYKELQPLPLNGWEQVFSLEELKELREWHLAIAYQWNSDQQVQNESSPEILLSDTLLALQIAAPIGTFLSVCIREEDTGGIPLLRTTRLERFHGTAWSRMRGFSGMTTPVVRSVVDGVIDILQKGNPRAANPLRLFQNGLASTNPYIRILLWVTAIDGILMAVKQNLFVERICALLGADSLVFPIQDDVFIQRSTTVRKVAGDLFQLRSELAHGQAISRQFWEARDDLADFLPSSVYQQPPRYHHLLEEVALSLLTRIVRLVILDGLVEDFSDPKKWKAKLRSLS